MKKLDGKSKALDTEDDVFLLMDEETKEKLINENREFIKKNNPHGLKFGKGNFYLIDL